MFKLFKNLKPMAVLLLFVILLVTGQAVAELYLPQKMSEIIDDGIFLDYEPLYKHEEMDKPTSLGNVDNDKTMKGYDKNKIPVFEMSDGFSTFDLKDTLTEINATNVRIKFQDIPVKDSKELFEEVISPFLDGLKECGNTFGKYRIGNDGNFLTDESGDYISDPDGKPIRDYENYNEEEKEQVRNVVNCLMVFDTLPVNRPEGGGISINGLLEESEDEDEDAMANDDNRKILTACIRKMKHSVYGNLMPIPVDENGKRIPTDEYGQALQQEKLIYKYSNDAGDEVPTASKSATGRPDVLPDYEVIMCNNVLGFAYKYKGDKWINHELGITDQRSVELANEHNTALLLSKWRYEERKFTEDFDKITYKKKIESIVSRYSDDMIILEKLGGLSRYSDKKLVKIIDKYYNDKVTGFDKFFIKLGNYLTLSKTETKESADAAINFKTAKEFMLADGNTIQTKNLNFILLRGGYMLLLTVAACTCAIIAALLSARIAANFSAVIRSQVFRKVETFSLREFDKFATASLITRSTNDINQIQTVFLLVLRTALIAPVTVIGGFILSAQKSVPMTLTILYPFPILIVASWVAAKVVFPLFIVIQNKVDRLTLIMREGLTGIRVVRAFNQQDRERKRFSEVNDSLTKTAIKVNKYCAILAPLIAVVMNCTMVGIFWVASKQIAYEDNINVGDMMAVSQYITQIMLALVMLATVFVMFPRASASAGRVNEVLETESTLKDPVSPVKSFSEVGSVRFENVNFKYTDDAEEYILSNISFKAEKGKVLAIVGGTGSGKSTVINLIPRFYDVNSGNIYIDGVNIKDMTQEDLRMKIGFVPQRSVLFSGTIRSNICYGKEDANEDELWEALRIAQSENFVKEKENGLESRVEQGGGNFSGGQKQRLAIARAIVRKPEVLIFDDSFSALDFRTDKNLRKALKAITSQSATIIVAQRIGTIMDADNIIVLDGGKIVGQGRHGELIKDCKLYRDIALSQMSEEELGL